MLTYSSGLLNNCMYSVLKIRLQNVGFSMAAVAAELNKIKYIGFAHASSCQTHMFNKCANF
jgi:hypothetical protein